MTPSFESHNENLRDAIKSAQRYQRMGYQIISRPEKFGFKSYDEFGVSYSRSSSYSSNYSYASPFSTKPVVEIVSYPYNIYAILPDVKADAGVLEKLIDDRPIILGECVTNVEDKTAMVRGVDTFDEVWTAEFPEVTIDAYGDYMIDALNKSISSTGQHRIIIWKNTFSSDPYKEKMKWVPSISNGTCSTPLNWFAVTDAFELVSVGLIGNGFKIDSIKMTLLKGDAINIDHSEMGNHQMCYVMKGDKYVEVEQVIRQCNLTSGGIVCTSAVKWSPTDTSIYALYFPSLGVSEEDILFSRIGEMVQSAIVPEWRDEIVTRAKKTSLINDLMVWGDCTKGWRISCDQVKWTNLIEQLLGTQAITVE